MIVRELGLTGRAFERECGLANGSYSSIRDGVGAEKLNKIFERYPQISADWLLRGIGEMMRQDEKRGVQESSGAIFEGSREYKISPLNTDDMKTILHQMANLVSGQQHDLSRLISEVEQNGKRSDRILSIVEQELARQNGSSYSQDSEAFLPSEMPNSRVIHRHGN
ncbi:MAG: hypothetical protein LBV38_03225 [Alistipes sp.]|nr:hypothetical protein [Alistipes sp.]